MNCAISGEVPVEPVVSKKSGLLYEKRLIETHISDFGKCPVTGEPHTIDDIVAVKTGKIVKPKPLHTASIPGLLGTFQTEWDGLMLSNFSLEQQLHTARQELSHALYQHDAACRVIARLKKERDEARQLLAEGERQLPAAPEVASENATLSNGKRAADGGEQGPDAKKMQWNPVKTLPDLSGTGRATCVKFGPDAKYVAVGSMDRNLRIFGLPSNDGTEDSAQDS
ncbi:hypothetical protein BRARA_J00263 [Brassica rapa]|uniref:Pre-mRNA-processing factor 19 n=1 Tax=Brassica campestris TaxID=3711 RepID=A0A397XHT9_BRACM|nr:hypothetical protein BRARA_J00263 [Brassica rapa]